jgi:hypothetical protein
VKDKKVLSNWINSKSEEERNYIRKKDEVKRTVNAEKNEIWNEKYTEISMPISEEDKVQRENS